VNMLECLLIGDSIAAGILSVNPECVSYATVGASSDQIVTHYAGFAGAAASYVVISMGSNWPTNPRNYGNAQKLRRGIRSPCVIWILPYNRKAAEVIKLVAEENQDSYIDLAAQPTKDKVHPVSYKRLSYIIRDVVFTFYD
jgi:hypothetical protein